jgi:hypothetical protein
MLAGLRRIDVLDRQSHDTSIVLYPASEVFQPKKEKYPLWTPLKRKRTTCKSRENLSGLFLPQRDPDNSCVLTHASKEDKPR